VTLVHDNAILFADGRNRHGCQHAAADCGHSSCPNADRQHADHRPAAHSAVCVDRRTQTLRTRKTSRRLAATRNARRRPQRSQRPLSQKDHLQTVNAILGKLNEGTRWPIELFRTKGDNIADSSVYTTVTLRLCGKKRPAV
jgi:hypothetical protein